MLRWLLFFLIGLPVQALVYAIYPLVVVYYYLFVRRNSKLHVFPTNPISPSLIEYNALTTDSLRDSCYLADNDNHGALLHAHLWAVRPELAEQGLANLVAEDGSLYRHYPSKSSWEVSGDCVSAWVFGYVASGINRPDLVQKVARHYLKNCFGIVSSTFSHYLYRGVSARCSNGGMTWVKDGYKGINQPCFGPQFYTSAALLALASSTSTGLSKILWRIVFELHYLLMGGLLWEVAPVIHPKDNPLYAAQHISCINLYSINKTLRPLLRFKLPLRLLSHNPQWAMNPFFMALYHDSVRKLPEYRRRQVELLLCSMDPTSAFKWQMSPPMDSSWLRAISGFYCTIWHPLKLILNK